MPCLFDFGLDWSVIVGMVGIRQKHDQTLYIVFLFIILLQTNQRTDRYYYQEEIANNQHFLVVGKFALEL